MDAEAFNPVHEPFGTPHHVREREVDQEHPEENEQEDGLEPDAFGHGPEDQRWRDDREHQLVHGEDVLRYPVGVIRVRCGSHSVKERLAQTSDQSVSAVEHQRVPDGPPEDGHHPRDAEALGDDGQDVLGTNQAAVEQEQARKGHEENQGRADHHEAVVARTRDADGQGWRSLGGIAVLDVSLQGRHAVQQRGVRHRLRRLGGFRRFHDLHGILVDRGIC